MYLFYFDVILYTLLAMVILYIILVNMKTNTWLVIYHIVYNAEFYMFVDKINIDNLLFFILFVSLYIMWSTKV